MTMLWDSLIEYILMWLQSKMGQYSNPCVRDRIQDVYVV
jgi:hypothetical protein